MLCKTIAPWVMPERLATPEAVYFNRRQILKSLGMGGMMAAGAPLIALHSAMPASAATSATTWPKQIPRNPAFQLDRDMTEEKHATSYVNFYEFGTGQNAAMLAQALPTSPWNLTIDGLVAKPLQIGFEDLLAQQNIEERLYRHRCVEAWAMAVPWAGFPMSEIVKLAAPLNSAKYILMETLVDEESMPGLSQFWYPWPYQEAVTMAEAMNPLAFIATGLYGKPLPKQNGAPIRLVLPWKYGFKSIKSIVRFTFTADRPATFWQKVQGQEYGFWANVNPEVAHPRWSQATERMLGSNEILPTQIYNGYGAEVAHLYKALQNEVLFR